MFSQGRSRRSGPKPKDDEKEKGQDNPEQGGLVSAAVRGAMVTITAMTDDKNFALSPQGRILFLTKDAELIRQQLDGSLTLSSKDIRPEELLDDINTDAMTPAWVCFDYDPKDIAVNAYAGLTIDGQRLFPPGALQNGNFEVIVSGAQKGVGSSRETAAQCEVFAGVTLAIASSFAPIHARNNINIGNKMGNYAMLGRLEAGESIPLSEFTGNHDPITKLIIESGGLLPFGDRVASGDLQLPKLQTAKRPMTMAEKIIAKHLLPGQGDYVQPEDAVLVEVDGGYSHEFTSAQVHFFLQNRYGDNYQIKDSSKFAVFEDHLIYADGVKKMQPFSAKIQRLRDIQKQFQKHTGVRDFGAKEGTSPGICHQVAREKIIEPGDLIQATDSHTCMGGASGALAWGVGATEYSALIYRGYTPITVPESIRFELTGTLAGNVTAKDLMLHILHTFAKQEQTLNRVMEFGGPGLFSLSPDERATLANMATECSARTAIMECDDLMFDWISQRRKDTSSDSLKNNAVYPDKGAHYGGGVHSIDLATIAPMVATPGDDKTGIPSDPKNGALVSEVAGTKVDIAYGGSCTAGKEHDVDFYAQVMADAEKAGRKVSPSVHFYIQFGSTDVAEYAREKGYLALFQRTGVKVISPGCGACIGCGPGVSHTASQTTISAINRNYKGRSGPGQLYLASPLTVAASAVVGTITAWKPGIFVTR